MQNQKVIFVIGLGILFLAAPFLSAKEKKEIEKKEDVVVAQGVAIINGTDPESKVSGGVMLTEVKGGLKVEARIENVSPGKHGFHIHEFGSCEDSAKAAGGHFNPNHSQHGFVEKDGHKKAHAGDLGNIEIGEDGKGTLSAFLSNVGLVAEKYNVAGRSFILHEKEDDGGQPTGNAGGRIGCGSIIVTK